MNHRSQKIDPYDFKGDLPKGKYENIIKSSTQEVEFRVGQRTGIPFEGTETNNRAKFLYHQDDSKSESNITNTKEAQKDFDKDKDSVREYFNLDDSSSDHHRKSSFYEFHDHSEEDQNQSNSNSKNQSDKSKQEQSSSSSEFVDIFQSKKDLFLKNETNKKSEKNEKNKDSNQQVNNNKNKEKNENKNKNLEGISTIKKLDSSNHPFDVSEDLINQIQSFEKGSELDNDRDSNKPESEPEDNNIK